SWGTSQLGVLNTADQPDNLNIAVAFESKSGEALVVYQNDQAATEMQYKTWSPTTGWSVGTNFGSINNQDTKSISLPSNPFSAQIQLMFNDNAKILRSDLWDGNTFAPGPPITPQPIQLETRIGTTDGQPFSFFWDRYLPGTVTTQETFTQTAPMTS